MKRFIFKLIILAFCVTAVIAVCTSCAGHSYDGVATQYLNAFKKFDYRTMYDLLTPGSRGAYTYDEFV